MNFFLGPDRFTTVVRSTRHLRKIIMVLNSSSSINPPRPGIRSRDGDNDNSWAQPSTLDDNLDPDASPQLQSLEYNSGGTGTGSNGDGNELANTKFPPPGMDPQLAAVRLAYLKETTKKARMFYEADRLLTQEDRVILFKEFQYEMFSQFVGGAVGAAIGISVGIVAPRHICKYLGRAYKPSYSQYGRIFTAVGGYSVGENIGYHQNLSAYQGNTKYLNVLKAVEYAPPLLGYEYYQETIRRPESAFPDPSKLDWTKYPAFPFTLAFFEQYKKDVKGIEPSYSRVQPAQNNQTPQGHKRPTDSSIDDDGSTSATSFSGDLEFSSDLQAGKAHQQTSSWDQIREGNGGKQFQWEPQNHSSHPSSTSSDFGPVVGSSGYRPNYAPDIDRPPPDVDTFEDPFAEKNQ